MPAYLVQLTEHTAGSSNNDGEGYYWIVTATNGQAAVRRAYQEYHKNIGILPETLTVWDDEEELGEPYLAFGQAYVLPDGTSPFTLLARPLSSIDRLRA